MPLDLNKPQHPVKVVYRNYRGEVAPREIIPLRLWFGATSWHPEPQWLLDCWDVAKNVDRTFALSDCDFARATY